ncbi:G-PROTEIN-RECEP-F1-2 domain-containing protein [Aphelenchoides bicaudatus]|nr:G-PROTEIN-RECEP-F1-2 domain-containing protein [Aphelenchoides bicaudatus]
MPPQYQTNCTSRNCLSNFVEQQQTRDHVLLHLLEWLEGAQPTLSYWLNGYLTLAFVCTGIVLNIFSIIVFLRFRQGSTTTIIQYYLISLTLWQTATLLSAFFLYCFPTLIYGKVILEDSHYILTYPCSYFFSNLSHAATVWLILTLTTDRFLSICYPLTHPSIGSKKRVKRLVLVVSASAIVFAVPRLFEVSIVYKCISSETVNITQECEPITIRSSFAQSAIYWCVYRIFLNALLVTLGPVLCCSILTLRITLQLNKSGERRKSLCQSNASECLLNGEIRKNSTANSACSSANKDHRANLILIMVILKFLVSNLLPSIVDFAEHIVGEDFASSSLATLIVDFSNLLITSNCATNFYIFVLSGKKFRQTCYYLLISSSIGMKFAKTFIESQVLIKHSRPHATETILSAQPKLNAVVLHMNRLSTCLLISTQGLRQHAEELPRWHPTRDPAESPKELGRVQTILSIGSGCLL